MPVNRRSLSVVEERARALWRRLVHTTPGEAPGSKMKEMLTVLEREPLRESPDKLLGPSREVSVSSSEQSSSSWETGRPRRLNTASILTSLFFLAALTLTSLMWLTNLFDTSLLKLVSIRNDIDMIYSLWRSPPTRPFISVYIFNYTNHEAAAAGKEIPHVQEIGPFVFRERIEKVKVQFNSNGTVTFQENRTMEYIPELSNGSLDQFVRVPNIPLLSILSRIRYMDSLIQKIIQSVINAHSVELFQKVSVHDFIWGYEDSLYRNLRKFKSLFHGEEEPKFGFLAGRMNGHHRVTVRTGAEDLDSVAEVTRIDGHEKLGVWQGECDEVRGWEGGLFPGNLVHRQEKLEVFSHALCRKIPLVYNGTTSSVDGFPVNQYIPNPNMFLYGPQHKENQCFNASAKPVSEDETERPRETDLPDFPPDGLFHAGACLDGIPMYASFPHFWGGDPRLREKIHGLSPDPERHQSYFQIHERLGVSLKVKTRFQMNVLLKKARFMAQFRSMADDTVFPVGYTEIDTGPLPAYFQDIVYHLTYTARTVQSVLKYTSLGLLVLSIYLLLKFFHIRPY